MPGLLEYLDSVPWGDYEHAYGTASDVPDLVLGLLDDDSRAEALDALFGTVWHQGTVYGASAPAATALAMIAAADGLPDRHIVIALLAAIACGSGYVQVHRSMMGEDEVDLDAAERREEREVREARQAVVQSVGALRPRLADDPVVEVRRALPYLMAVCDDQAARPLLRASLESESDAVARASAVLALGALGDRELPDGPEPVVRLAAAVAAGDAARIGTALDGLVDLGALGIWTDGEAVPFVLQALSPDDQLAVLAAMAEAPDADTRHAAVYAATDLAATWRSPTPRIVELLAALLRDDAADVAEAAARGLHDLCPSSAPAADALLAAGTATALRALSRLRDGRVVPMLAAALADDDPAPWTGDALQRLGTAALDVRDRVIALLPTLPAPGYGAAGPDNRLIEFTLWLGGLGPYGAPAVPAIIAVLRGGKADHAALLALGALDAIAVDARPELECFLDHDDSLVRAQAAAAVKHIAGDDRPLRRVTEGLLAAPQRGALTAALDELDEFEPERLQPLLSHADEWVRLPAARAIWRITCDHRTVADTLRAIAGPTPAGEQALAVLAEMPPETVAPLRDQLTQWRDADRRPAESAVAAEVVERDQRLRDLATRLLRAS